MNTWKLQVIGAALVLPSFLQGNGIDFNRDIRPILSENCAHCHGPDANKREAGLRLDTAEGAEADLGGYQALVPGKPEESALWLRVNREADDSEVMPPRKSKRQLSAAQKDLIKRWIESGGQYEQLWSLVPPKKSPIPKGKNAIDHFVGAGLREKGLSLSPPADPQTLIRRLSLDVIGLPPTPQEVAEFRVESEANPEQAWERLIDRLLASPRYGERWARPWLDLARYADSNGFQADQLRDSWAYRDWVIDALNSNMPYDRFSIEQIAGDLLPEPTLAQKIATGFHRTVTCNVEAGVHPEENRVNQVIDRVNTTGTVWLGITLSCAQCHDHKYDPLTMREYYQLFAFFNNTPLEVSLPKGKDDVSHDFIGPYLDLPESEALRSERQKLQAALREIEAEKRELSDTEKFQIWLASIRQRKKADPTRWDTFKVSDFQSTGGETHQVLDDESVLINGAFNKTTTFRGNVSTSLSKLQLVRLEILTHENLPQKRPVPGDGERTNSVLTDFKVYLNDAPLKLTGAKASFSQAKWDVAGAIDDDEESGWGIAPEFFRDQWAIFQLVEPIDLPPGARLHFEMKHQDFGGRFRLAGAPQLATKNLILDDPALLALAEKDQLSAQEEKKLREQFEKSVPALVRLEREAADFRSRLSALKPNQTLVMEEMSEARLTHVMKRGNYLDPGEELTPGTPHALPPFSPDLPRNRLGLARWLVSRDNPLTARVAVNRWWAEIFGRGIVATPEDFGTQCEPPTHPALLDWLAVEFMDSGWDLKHLLRQIFLSSTYRQSSQVVNLSADPANLFLSRSPRFRFEAERIRDNALAVSGLLSTKMYGRPVMPYQPPNLWRQVGRNEPVWVEAKNEDRWRRGIYIVYRRAAPYPSMVNFDAPDRGACTVQRPRTNTPLQALTLLNDPSYLEMALALADRVLTETTVDDDGRRIEFAFQLVFARSARVSEAQHLETALRERLEYFRKNPGAAAKLVAEASPVYRPRHRDPVELAAWFYLGNILLNLDETVTRP